MQRDTNPRATMLRQRLSLSNAELRR